MQDEPSDEALEALLREHLAAQLDPQLGRALASLEQHAVQPAAQNAERAEQNIAERRQDWTSVRVALLAAVAGALAASIVVAVVLRQSAQPVAMPPAANQHAAPALIKEAPTKNTPAGPEPEAVAEQQNEPPQNAARSAAQEPPAADSSQAVASANADAAAGDGKGEPQLVKKDVEWRVLNSEIVELGSGTPVRKLRRQRLEQREYFDPQQGARMKLILPREEVRYESIPTQ
jgi:hypothetical protein